MRVNNAQVNNAQIFSKPGSIGTIAKVVGEQMNSRMKAAAGAASSQLQAADERMRSRLNARNQSTGGDSGSGTASTVQFALQRSSAGDNTTARNQSQLRAKTYAEFDAEGAQMREDMNRRVAEMNKGAQAIISGQFNLPDAPLQKLQE